MKSIYLSLICLLLVASCKSDKTETKTQKDTLTVAQKIANAHGFEHWDKVKKVEFTFKVDRDTIKGQGRRWTWFPKEDKVLLSANFGEVEYTRSQMDSTHINADRAFINDKFWMFIPFQLVWDSSATILEPKTATSPIKNDSLQMISITYPNEGGYTPGDAYDIYFDNNFMIKEWSFRKANAKAPTLSNTFENYQDFKGIKIAIDHKKDNGNWNLNFADVNITLE